MDRAEALALLTRYYAAFNAGDWQGMLDCLADDVTHDINQGATQRGKAVFGAFLAHMERCYKERLDGIVLMASEDGTRGAAEFTVHGKYLATDEGLPEAAGQTYVLPAGAFFAFSGGKITRVTVYYNLADWTAQVVG
ncbi:MAG: ketosteroid isomerase-related protein [Novosphingobium sp.]